MIYNLQVLTTLHKRTMRKMAGEGPLKDRSWVRRALHGLMSFVLCGKLVIQFDESLNDHLTCTPPFSSQDIVWVPMHLLPLRSLEHGPSQRLEFLYAVRTISIISRRDVDAEAEGPSDGDHSINLCLILRARKSA